MTTTKCPELHHYHISFEQIGSFKKPFETVVAATPNEALEAFLPTLPAGWKGGVSVYDDLGGHEDEMPLLHHYV
jgi:hypothetical protein